MKRLTHSLMMSILLATGAAAQSPADRDWLRSPETAEQAPAVLSLDAGRDELGLPGNRPRLAVNLSMGSADQSSAERSAFSWSLETWQLNTASLAHIQCSRGTLTVNAYLAEDCRFVDQPLPHDSINLVKVRGDWMPRPGLQLGIGAFRSGDPDRSSHLAWQPDFEARPLDPGLTTGDFLSQAVEGLDVNVSFGIRTDRVGDFLVGLQLARYRQLAGLSELDGLPPLPGQALLHGDRYGSSAQLMLGWRRGSFSGEMLGRHQQTPVWLSGEPTETTFNSFDLEFSWHAPRNGSLSIGVSNIMDAAPRADEPAAASGLEDPLENVYGRIPYVRYKQDL
ncbi:MAG: hypothetical protein HND55_01895 [Pseudomonadota bacterium]|nr:MAG: hypothetical protein HND55_01895 [Pseudomonadota bacterium]